MEKLSIAAFILPIIIFLFWMVIGYAFLSLVRTQRHLLQNALLSPTIGMVITLLPTFWLSRIGLPVSQFALLETIFLLGFSFLLLFKTKPYFPLRYYLPFGVVLLGAFLLTGSPLLRYGFNWISYSNDDMTNYCLSALRLLHHGYNETPNLLALKYNQDISLYYWFMTVPRMIRPGADLLLAFCSAITHLMPIKIFMPLIMALHLCLISAAGALVCQSKRFRNIALTTMIVLAFSAVNTLGTIYQLIAQVGGIALLLSSSTILLQTYTQHYRYNIIKQSSLISLLIMALLIFYPEVAGFLFISILLFLSILFFQGWRPNKQFVLTTLFSICICLFALNQYWINIISFIHTQVLEGIMSNTNYIFPYFLFPNGLADIWGLQVIALLPSEPWLSRSIFCGGILLIITFLSAIYQMIKNIPIATVFFVMFIITLYFFIQHVGFTLFKLAMYLQPALIGVLVIFIYWLIPKNSVRILVIVLLCYYSWKSQKEYVAFSHGQLGQLYVAVTNASMTHMSDELEEIMHSIPNHTPVIIATPNIVLAKLISLSATNKFISFPSNNFFWGYYYMFSKKNYSSFSQWFPQTEKTAEYLVKKISTQYMDAYFYLHNPDKPFITDAFLTLANHPSPNTVILLSSANRNIFNRSQLPETDKNFLVIPWKKAANLLLFVSSSLGEEYYGGREKNISLYNLEKDYFYPKKGLAGIGQYLLFSVINPSDKIRAVLQITNSFGSRNTYYLPNAMIEGTKRKSFQIIGSGSARVFSPVIKSQQINHAPYLLIDLGKSIKLTPNVYTGLMNLYGKRIPRDNRYIITYARNISVISDEEYQKMKAPSHIEHFPADLSNPNLEYSGIFEDGWLSNASFVVLAQTEKQNKLLIQGNVPLIKDNHFTTELTIYLNGKKIMNKVLTVGKFMIKIPTDKNPTRNKIELHFSKTQSYGSVDYRDFAAKVDYIGFIS